MELASGVEEYCIYLEVALGLGPAEVANSHSAGAAEDREDGEASVLLVSGNVAAC